MGLIVYRLQNRLFPCGAIVCTPSILENVPISTIDWCLGEHLQGNWGFLTEDDWNENEFSLREGFRLFSAYFVSLEEKIWIITEADRSSTTILYPHEY